ncbi:MAG: DMT family transporter [Ferruginibacter sp.]
MSKTIWIIVVFIAGALLPIQAGLNSRIGKEIQSPFWASLFSFGVGLIAMAGYVLLTKQKMNIAGVSNIPLTYWVAGALGAFYITVMVLAFPKIGAPMAFGLIVAGQLTISLLLDHYKILVQQQHAINMYRLLGMLLIVCGVILIRKF